MALVKKFKEGDKTNKVLTYENVGTYNAEDLAKNLTKNLESYADSLNLKGLDRRDFMEKGATMIRAIKEGNVTKNADGSYSIAGEYGLNNDYTNDDISEMKSEHKVGRGAQRYVGLELESHGIFTTDKTKNFRHNNHVLGLVGRLVDSTLNEMSSIEESTYSKEENPVAYSFTQAFSDANLGGNNSILAQWADNNKTPESRIAAITKALNNADYDKWTLAIGNDKYTSESLKQSVEGITNALNVGNIEEANNLAYALGFDISPYLIKPSLKKDDKKEPTRLETYWNTYKAEIIKEHPEYSDADVEIALKKAKTEAAAKSPEQLKLNKENENALLEAINARTNSIQAPEILNFTDDKVHTFENSDFRRKVRLLTAAASLNENSEIPEEIHNTLDALVDAYGNGSNLNNLDAFIKNQYMPITEGVYKGYIALPMTTGEYYTFVFDPKTKEIKKVHNLLLNGTPGYSDYITNFSTLWKQEHPVLQVVYKLGGVFKAVRGAATLAWIDLVNKSVSNTKVKSSEKTSDTAETSSAPSSTEVPTPQSTKFKDIENWDSNDWADATSAGLDLSALLVSMFGSEAGGSLLSGGLGLGSTIAQAKADFGRTGVTAENFKNLGTNLTFDAIGLLPWGRLAKSGKTMAKVAKYAPYLGAAAAAVMAPDLAVAFKKSLDVAINSPSDLTAEDASNLLNGISLVTTFRNNRKANKFVDKEAKTTGATVKTDKGKDVKIDKEGLDAINNADTYEAQNNAFKEAQIRADHNLTLETAANLPKETKRSKLTPWKVTETGNAKVSAKPTVEVPSTYFRTGVFGGIQVHETPKIAPYLTGLKKVGFVEAAADTFGKAGRWTYDKGKLAVLKTGEAGRHALGLYSAEELGLDSNKTYTSDEISALIKAKNDEVKAKRKAIKEEKEEIKAELKALKETEKNRKKYIVGRAKEINRLHAEAKLQAARQVRQLKITDLKTAVSNAFSKLQALRKPVSSEVLMPEPQPVEAPAVNHPVIIGRSSNIASMSDKEIKDVLKRSGKPHTNKDVLRVRKTGSFKLGGLVDFARKVLETRSEKLNLEELKAKFFKVGGQFIIKAKNGYRITNSANPSITMDFKTWQEALDFLSSDEGNWTEPIEIDLSSVPLPSNAPKWLTITDDTSAGWDTTKNELNKGWGYQVGDTFWGNNQVAAQRAATASNSKITLSLGYTRNPTIDTSSLTSAPQNGTKTGGNYNTYGKEALTEAALVEAYYAALQLTGEAKDKAIAAYNTAKDKYLETTPNKQWQYYDPERFNFTLNMLTADEATRKGWSEELKNGIVEYLKWQSSLHADSTPSWSLFKKNDNGSTTQTFENIDWSDKGVQGFLNGRKDAAKRDTNGNILYNANGTILLSDTKLSGGPAHRSVSNNTYGTGIVNWVKDGDSNYKIEDDLDTELYTYQEGDDADSYTTDKNITNKYWIRNEKVRKEGDTYYYLGDDGVWKTKDGQKTFYPNTGEEHLISENPLNTDINLKTSTNWGLVLEIPRAAFTNIGNIIAANQVMNWQPAMKDEIHRLELLLGDYLAEKTGEENAAAIESLANRTYTSDAEAQKRYQLTGKESAIDVIRKAHDLDAEKFYETQHKVLDTANLDLIYNTNVHNENLAAISEKEKYDANIKGNLTIENTKNISNLWAGINKTLMDNADRNSQLALTYNQTLAAEEKAIANSKLKTTIATLKPGTPDYELKLNKAYATYLKEIRRIESLEVSKAGKIASPSYFRAVSLAKSGSKITAALKAIMLSNKDFNKRKLADAREFYKTMRENRKNKKK